MRVGVIVSSTVVLTVGSSCVVLAANWGTFQKDQCRAPGTRQYSSKLLNVSGSWEAACTSTSATVAGQSFSSPTRCVNKGAFGMWGEFDVSDNTWVAGWGGLEWGAWRAPGLCKISSRLGNMG